MIIKANQTVTKEMQARFSIPLSDTATIPKGRLFKPIKETDQGRSWLIYRKHNKLSEWRAARIEGWSYRKEWFDVVSE